MTDPLDNKTTPLPLAIEGEAAPGVPSITQARVEARLQNEFDLVRLHGPVYVQDKKAAAARSAGAERVAKHRQKLAAEGLRPTAVPASLLDEVKQAGGWTEWQAQKTAIVAPLPPEIVERTVEVPGPERIVEVPGPERIVNRTVEVPAKLNSQDMASLKLGRKAQALTGWRKALMSFALS